MADRTKITSRDKHAQQKTAIKTNVPNYTTQNKAKSSTGEVIE
jgi:hypothetical protein